MWQKWNGKVYFQWPTWQGTVYEVPDFVDQDLQSANIPRLIQLPNPDRTVLGLLTRDGHQVSVP